MTVDAGIVAIFGEPPIGIDLAEQTTSRDNTIVVCLCVLALVSFAGRIWARRIKGAPLWLDDWLVLVSLVRWHHLHTQRDLRLTMTGAIAGDLDYHCSRSVLCEYAQSIVQLLI